MSDPRALFRTRGRAGCLSLAEAFPVTACFGALRIDFESAVAARRWLCDQLAHAPEQDCYGWFTKAESPQEHGRFDSIRLLDPDEAATCRSCGARAHVAHLAHGPVCCSCSDEIGRAEFSSTKPKHHPQP